MLMNRVLHNFFLRSDSVGRLAAGWLRSESVGWLAAVMASVYDLSWNMNRIARL